MSWADELDELQRRRAHALAMGGAEGLERQARNGKLNVRERIEALTDPGSFREFRSFLGEGTYDESGAFVKVVPRGMVEGMCRIGGRKVVLVAGDATVRGGSGGGPHGGLGEEQSASERALAWQLPYVRLLDSAGGSVRSFEDLGRTYLPDGNSFTAPEIHLLSRVPCVSAVLGAAAGLPALHAVLAHFNVMTVRNAQVFPGGPPVVKAALGYDITKEDLGGHQIHTRESGTVDNLAQDEQDAFDQIRRFLSYLPPSVFELPPRGEPVEPDPERVRALRTLVPRNPRQVFDPHRLIEAVVDAGSFFEIAPLYGRARITGLARIDGYPVGVMANDPRRNGGATDVAAGDKAIRLMQLCDTFHLPLVDFADEPGLMVGLESERRGIERAGVKLICTVIESRMPWLVFVVRRLYGVGGQSHHRPSGMYRRYAWPSASWGSMHIAGGAAAAYRREIEAADDPVAKLAEIENRLRQLASPFRTAEATGQDIIDPAQTRELTVEFVHDAQRVLATHLGQPVHSYRP
jgi:acetyl-CoA carboxylase carboxyltransferase component